MKKLVLFNFLIAFLWLGCKPNSLDNPQLSDNPSGVSSRIKVLQKREADRKEFLAVRKEARKKFDQRLTLDEKTLIHNTKRDYLTHVDKFEKEAIQRIEESNWSNKDSVYSLMELEINKMKSFQLGLNEMLQIVGGKYKKEINEMSLKYYEDILKVESEYSLKTESESLQKRIKFCQKKLKEIEEGKEEQVVQKIDGIDYYWGKMDYCMGFLLINLD